MTTEKIEKTLEAHQLWLKNEGGKKADLQEADLQGANLQGANLRGANLQGADLRRANLQEANLQEADLRWANLRWVNLQGANLQEADLRWANLREVNLRGANLQGADLMYGHLDTWQVYITTTHVHAGCCQWVHEEAWALRPEDVAHHGATLSHIRILHSYMDIFNNEIRRSA